MEMTEKPWRVHIAGRVRGYARHRARRPAAVLFLEVSGVRTVCLSMAAVVQNLFERKIRIPTFHKQFESSSQRV
jgi:hypothetical protein